VPRRFFYPILQSYVLTLTPRIADYLGRRYAMVAECLMFIIGVIVQMTSFTVWQQFAVGRFISGLGVGALSAAVPMVPLISFVIPHILLNLSTVPSRDSAIADSWNFNCYIPTLHHLWYPRFQLYFHWNSQHGWCQFMANGCWCRYRMARYSYCWHSLHARISSVSE
jgi:hypothetical protein